MFKIIHELRARMVFEIMIGSAFFILVYIVLFESLLSMIHSQTCYETHAGDMMHLPIVFPSGIHPMLPAQTPR
jgi:hypothetical protein